MTEANQSHQYTLISSIAGGKLQTTVRIYTMQIQEYMVMLQVLQETT